MFCYVITETIHKIIEATPTQNHSVGVALLRRKKLWKKQIEVCQCPCGNGIILDRGSFSAITRTVTWDYPKSKEKTIPTAQIKNCLKKIKRTL